MNLNAKIGGLMDFWRFWAATQIYHSQGGATLLSLCGQDRIENLVFVY